jgi:Flavin reductase like domain
MTLTTPAHPTPDSDARAFRDALARFATGVAFVTAAPDGEPAGLVVNTLMSVSLEPPPRVVLPGAQLAHLDPNAPRRSEGWLRVSMYQIASVSWRARSSARRWGRAVSRDGVWCAGSGR